MKKIIFSFIIINCQLSIVNSFAQQAELSRIAFGSCSFQNGEQLIWNEVIKNDPQLWIWLGDAIYANTTNMQKMQKDYEQAKNNPNYQLLLQQCPVIGTWDDHDFGANDIGKDYLKKTESQPLFLDFIGEPSGSPRRKQEGVYTSYTYGEGAREVKIILLDTRYFRDDPGEDADILGETQWQWLEKELRESKAKINIIGSSIQVVSNDTDFEKWGHFPKSRKRLINLLGSSGAQGVIILSGDKHIADLSKYEGPEISYPIYDFTSSGLTHDRAMYPFEFNTTRVAGPYLKRNFGLILIDWENKRLTFLAKSLRGDIKLNYLIELREIGVKD